MAFHDARKHDAGCVNRFDYGTFTHDWQ